LGQLIVQVGELVAKQTDSWIHSINNKYPKDKLYNIIRESKTCKARLLYYYPLSKKDMENFDDWCGWHYDHGSLTGLTKALFEDEHGNRYDNKDKEAGLFIRNRKGDLVRAVWDDDMIAFQIGESAMIHSGGLCVATPHCVRGTTVPNISRSTFAVFMQPQIETQMSPPEGTKIEDCHVNVLKEGMDFALFTEKRLAEYY
jgi:isopenicillin N synthase-like dioxygenase